jgi:hypothetical protein
MAGPCRLGHSQIAGGATSAFAEIYTERKRPPEPESGGLPVARDVTGFAGPSPRMGPCGGTGNGIFDSFFRAQREILMPSLIHTSYLAKR